MNLALACLLFVLSAPAAALAQTPPAGPLDLVSVGRCVWDKLTPTQKAPMIAAAESSDTGAMNRAQNSITPVAWYRLIDECDPRGVDDDRALAMISAMTIQESEAVVLARDSGLVREQIDEAIRTAPPESTVALLKIVRDRAAGGGPASITPAIAAVLPIATALKVAEPDKFLATPTGRRLITYCLDYYQTREVVAQGAR